MAASQSIPGHLVLPDYTLVQPFSSRIKRSENSDGSIAYTIPLNERRSIGTVISTAFFCLLPLGAFIKYLYFLIKGQNAWFEFIAACLMSVGFTRMFVQVLWGNWGIKTLLINADHVLIRMSLFKFKKEEQIPCSDIRGAYIQVYDYGQEGASDVRYQPTLITTRKDISLTALESETEAVWLGVEIRDYLRASFRKPSVV